MRSRSAALFTGMLLALGVTGSSAAAPANSGSTKQDVPQLLSWRELTDASTRAQEPGDEVAGGAASVAMVIQYWGGPQASAALELEREEIRLADMRRQLEQAGFHAFTIRGQWADLERHLAKGRPVIVGIRKEQAAQRIQFVVLTSAQGDFVWLNDPTRRKPSRIGQGEFNRQWALAGHWILLSTPSRLE